MLSIVYLCFSPCKSSLHLINAGLQSFLVNVGAFLDWDVASGILLALAFPAVTALAAGLASLWSWYGLYTVASAALFTAWQRDWQGFRTTVESVINGLSIGFETLSDLPGTLARVWPEFSAILTNLGNNMLDWGSNLAEMLAQGFMNSINAIMDALIYMSELITYWLIPGSPPKLLPDLDTWGTGAADAWLEGWTKADFSILDSISNSIKSTFESIGENIDVTELENIQTAVAAAIGGINSGQGFEIGRASCRERV